MLAALVAAALVPAAAQAAPQPHVWVHYDYLVYPDGRSDAPDPAAIQRVVDAYAAHGIRLEIDPEHTAIPASDPVLVFDPNQHSACDGMSFAALKRQYFKGHARHDWHYAIFGRAGQVTTSANSCQGGPSGFGELRGDDFVIALGGLDERGFSPSRIDEITAGTFMHELGHNLGLRHGGGVSLNWKPNYLSVMNYAFQSTGIPYASTPGAEPDHFRLDYSDETLPTLDPQHLNETVGVQGDSADWTRFISACPGADWRDCQSTFLAPAGGPIDWDGDGDATETDVAATLLDGRSPFPDIPAWLGGFDDWAAVRSYLGDTRPRPNPPIPHEQPLLVGP